MAKKKSSDETKIIDEIYPIIEEVCKTKWTRIKGCIERFFHKNHEQLYDYAPIERIYFLKKDVNDYFNSIGIKEDDILDIIKTLYYYNQDEIQPCKDPFSISQLMVVRYFAKKKDNEKTELSLLYLAFSGKYYAYCHYRWFPNYIPKREIMDYVVNYMLSKKFDLISQGSVFGAIRSLTRTWLKKYNDVLIGNDTTDEELVYLMHQLRERIYAFFRNIAQAYHKAVEEKLYLNQESDRYDEDNYRISKTNSTAASAITEKTMNYFTTSTINMSRCQAAAGKGVDPAEIKAIFENILNNNDRLDQLREVINILIVDYMRTHPDVKPKDIPTSVDFIDYSIKAKPNTKDKNLIKMKNMITEWLNTSSRYRNTKTPATLNNYYRGILIYIVLTINAADKES